MPDWFAHEQGLLYNHPDYNDAALDALLAATPNYASE